MFVINEEIDLIFEKIKIDNLKNKKILITGASGLLGVYFVSYFKKFLSQNVELYVWIKSNIEEEFKEVFLDCYVIQSDITDPGSFLDLPFFDVIIHAAGYGQPGKFLENKIKTIEINTVSTINLFKSMNKNGYFLFLSTSELYSGINDKSITELQIGNTNTNHTRSCYIEGKRCGESICFSYSEMGYNVKIARLSLAYGPGTKKGDARVLNSLFEKGLKNNSIELLDNGSSIRTYGYISDITEMLLNILFFGKETIYNVGGKSELSIFDLATKIGKLCKKVVKIPEDSKGLNGSPQVVNISIDKYINEFEKKDFISIDEGLGRTFEWQKKLYNNE